MARGFHPHKRLGQCFLIDNNITKKIIEACNLKEDEVILEIGSGKGVLTRQLAERVKKVIAVELDRKLFSNLEERFQKKDSIILFNRNILKFDLRNTLKHLSINNKITVVANIPYHITTAIFEFIFEHIDVLDAAYLMVQKEFAERVVAQVGTEHYSSLSCFVQYYTNPRVLFGVGRGCFRPQPKVDSCFIELIPKPASEKLPKADEELLFAVIRAAFHQRRKNIVNALSSILEKETASHIVSSLGFDYRLRAENLSLDDYIMLMQKTTDYIDQNNRKDVS